MLYYGFKYILFRSSVCNNERDFPETLLFDTWTLCSLQRKLRVDMAALCTASHVQALYENLGLDGTSAVACVVQTFLSVAYGERVRRWCWLIAVVVSFDRRFVQGLDDQCMKLTLPNRKEVIEHINAELSSTLPLEFKGLLKSSLAGCASPWEAKYKHM